MDFFVLTSRTLPSSVTPLLSRIQSHPRAVAAALVVSALVPWVIGNYRAFIALGKGGLPSNPIGYSIAMIAKPFGKETTSTSCYDKDEDKSTWLQDPQSIPERRGERPRTGWHFLPHRQVDRLPSQEAKKKLDAIFAKRAKDNTHIVELAVSPHERMHDAMVVASSVVSPHKVADHALREIAHIHPEIDYSLHVTLSPQDCKLVIEHGWGERHPLSGTKALPKEYLLIYAPRDDEELEVVDRIIVATIGYMTGRRDVH
ncbi:hypothetical protein HYDPIDRAFT_120246 [Hydnomerulius pinastri MD-312]|uniref:Unplaced genomic scaffold scaffold_237, whole genome shotgun sequence n=1 Tax=Hydnomerulius pinastri MD-312 TaxID=994086 RepID=A0A0C9VX39_9AGAM|nr:hypothetical protein HYDPIDRAFT_120246 [Hydnomerulius pinastri MD-312]